LRTKHEATAKTNATGWYLLTAIERHAGMFEFLTKYQGGATYTPLDRDKTSNSDGEGGLERVVHPRRVFLCPGLQLRLVISFFDFL
jgi:hypothetical protein